MIGRYAPITINGLVVPPALLDVTRYYCRGNPPHEFGVRGWSAGPERRQVRLFDLQEIAQYNGLGSAASPLLGAVRSTGLNPAEAIVIAHFGVTDPVLLDYAAGRGRPRVVCPAGEGRIVRASSLRRFLMSVQFPRLAAMKGHARAGTPVEALAATADAGLRWIIWGT